MQQTQYSLKCSSFNFPDCTNTEGYNKSFIRKIECKQELHELGEGKLRHKVASDMCRNFNVVTYFHKTFHKNIEIEYGKKSSG